MTSDKYNDELGPDEVEALKEAVNKLQKTVFSYDNSHTSSLQQVYNGASQHTNTKQPYGTSVTASGFFTPLLRSGKEVSVNIGLDTEDMLKDLRSTLNDLLHQSSQKLTELSEEYGEVEKEVISLQQKISDIDKFLLSVQDET